MCRLGRFEDRYRQGICSVGITIYVSVGKLVPASSIRRRESKIKKDRPGLNAEMTPSSNVPFPFPLAQ